MKFHDYSEFHPDECSSHDRRPVEIWTRSPVPTERLLVERAHFRWNVYKEILESSINNDETNAQSEGPEKELLVNINCPLKLILNYIRDEVGLDGPTEFDLCDEINCQLRKVSFFEPHTSGLNIFKAGLTYFIITYQRDANGQMTNLTPLLSGKTAKRCSEILLKSNIPQKKSLSVRSTLKKRQS